MADAGDLKSLVETHAGSNPAPGTHDGDSDSGLGVAASRPVARDSNPRVYSGPRRGPSVLRLDRFSSAD